MSTEDGMTIPYSVFVSRLFIKPETVAGKLAHAAVGIVGELMELRGATDREEALEELGDLKFYVQAARNHLPDWPATSSMYPATQFLAQLGAEVLACELLDFAKKLWIYEKELTEPIAKAMLVDLAGISYALEIITSQLGFTDEQVELYNRKKLLTRYEGGVYTDAGAQARADKPQGA